MGVQNQPQYTTLSSLVDDIQSIMQVYRSNVLDSIENNIDKCADIFIKEVQNESPIRTGEYKRSWAKKKLRKAKYVIYVGNTKRVKRRNKKTGEQEKKLPLINILEFSTDPDKYRPHVGKAVANSKNQIVDTIANGIEKVSK